MPLDNPFEPMIKNIGNYVSGTLYAQGVIPPIGIDHYEGLALASPADTHLLAAKDAVINEIAVGMSGNLIGENTVTGAPPLQLPNSAGYPLQGLEVALSPYQEGSGDPSPDNVRPIHGTNKLNLFVADSYDPTATPTAVIDVPPLSANQWDEEWRNGYYKVSTGEFITASAYFANKNPINVKPNTSYYIGSSVNETWEVFYYDSDMVYLSYDSKTNTTFTTPSNCAYINFSGATTFYGNIYNHDISINYPSTVTTYNPYSNTIYNGTIGSEGGESRWGEVDLGTLTWVVNSEEAHIFMCNPPNIKPVASDDYTGRNKNAICEAYKPSTSISISSSMDDMSWLRTINQYFVRDTNYSTLSDFVASVSGVKLIYELVTPTTLTLSAPTIPTPRGSATTWATAEDGTVDSMSVAYIQNE